MAKVIKLSLSQPVRRIGSKVATLILFITVGLELISDIDGSYLYIFRIFAGKTNAKKIMNLYLDPIPFPFAYTDFTF